MQIFDDIRGAQVAGPTYLTIGNFDGLHRGHQALLAYMQTLAAQHDSVAQTALVTFSPHPLAVLRPETDLQLLTTPAERLRLAAAQGIDVGVIQPFDAALAALSAREFVTLLKDELGMVGLVVGPDFALGRNRAGDLPTLRALGQELGYELYTIEPIDLADKAVRSSVIRQDLRTGDVCDAADLLGRAYHATGVVVEGDRRGRTIGIPTANIQTRNDKLLPADGVYVTRAYIVPRNENDEASMDVSTWQAYDSVSNLGVRPTVDGENRRLEAHLFDFPRAGQSSDLYGETLRIEFLARLRGEQRFDGLDQLLAQIQRDIAAARTLFETVNS